MEFLISVHWKAYLKIDYNLIENHILICWCIKISVICTILSLIDKTAKRKSVNKLMRDRRNANVHGFVRFLFGWVITTKTTFLASQNLWALNLLIKYVCRFFSLFLLNVCYFYACVPFVVAFHRTCSNQNLWTRTLIMKKSNCFNRI